MTTHYPWKFRARVFSTVRRDCHISTTLEISTLQTLRRRHMFLHVHRHMFPCPICTTVFTKRKDVDQHLTQEHADQPTPYGCETCSACFSSEKAAKQHHKKRHQRDPDVASKRQKVDGAPPLPLPLPFVGTVTDWVHTRYNPSRATLVEQLAPSTIARIDGFAQRLRFGPEDHTLAQILLTDEGTIIDAIDEWMDLEQQQTHELQTINNHVRYLHFLLLFHQECMDSPHVEANITDYLADLVQDTQSNTTRLHTTLNVLKLEDPFALAHIRDTVVNALRKEQIEEINPYILSTLLVCDTPHTHVAFGMRLRNWLELVIRFTNIPCRIQCTREMELSTSTSLIYVSKLVVRDGQYCRLINNDKSSKTHQPLLLPLGRCLSIYLYIYLTYCRPPTAQHSFVFCSSRGTQWARPSRDLKHYMEDVLGISVHDVDPTGRFIHGSRAIMMAVFAVRVDFDQQKMHGFARLLRHSSTTNERHYSMWQQKALSNQSIDVFARMMDLDFTSATMTPACYVPVTLQAVPARLTAVFLHGFEQHNREKGNVVPCHGTCSVGTQTGAPDDDGGDGDSTGAPGEGVLEIDVAATQPRCTTCGNFSLKLFGPFGSMRRKRYAGRYFLACPTCHRMDDGRFQLPRCRWYPLGFQPLQQSNSARPRNMLEIQDFIRSRGACARASASASS